MKNTEKESKDTFDISGPIHLTTVDWNNPHHRRSVAACLVKGVYVQESDRLQKRQEPNALGPPWWQSFNFQLHSRLVDDDDVIFGAIYELLNPAEGAPTHVIAFRGTNKRSLRDQKLNLKCIKGSLHQTSRYEIALKNVRDMVNGGSNIWLAGHSLGAAIGMCVGKNMAKMGTFLEVFLFNPPFISAPIEIIKNEKPKRRIRFFFLIRNRIRIVGSIITALATVAVKGNRSTCPSEDPFVALSEWVPCLFVNPADHICSEFIGYFENRGNMQAIGLESIERLSTQNSLGGLISTAIGRDPVDSEPLHLLPSANLTINRSPSLGFRRGHGISQWWNPDLHFQSKEYIYSFK